MTKSTLYDMLSMIIPGYLLVLGVKLLCAPDCLAAGYTLDSVVVVFVLSYLLGLVLHHLSKLLFDPVLRNKPARIRAMHRKPDLADEPLDDLTDDEVLARYYTAYYKVMRHYPYTAVPILEAQVSFIRSMVCVILFYLLSACCISGYTCLPTGVFVLLLIVAEVVLCLLMFKLQDNIYRAVWEDYYYITRKN